MKLDFRKTFRLKTPRPGFVLASVLLWIGIALCSSTLLYLQDRVFPFPKQLLDYMQKLLGSATEHSFASVFLVVAVLPAICEEMTFRGVVLSGLLSRNRPPVALILTAALFAAFHLSLYRFLPVFLIGLAASYIVYRSGSIFTGMLLHLFNNGLVVYYTFHAEQDTLGLMQMTFAPVRFLIGLTLVAAALLLTWKRKREISDC